MTDSQSTEENRCRYCLETDNDNTNPLIVPCKCDGSLKYVHRKCLDKWRAGDLDSENVLTCEICHEDYCILSKKNRCSIKYIIRNTCHIFSEVTYGYIGMIIFIIWCTGSVVDSIDHYICPFDIRDREKCVYFTATLFLYFILSLFIIVNDISVIKEYGKEGSDFYFKNYGGFYGMSSKKGNIILFWVYFFFNIFMTVMFSVLGMILMGLLALNYFHHVSNTLYVLLKIEDNYVLDIREVNKKNGEEDLEKNLL